MSIKQMIKAPFKPIRRFKLLLQAVQPLYPRTCPICEYHGKFDCFGRPPRVDARCFNCSSVERHRLFWLWFTNNHDRFQEPFVHFAAERVLASKFREIFKDYRTADLFKPADLKLNLENIDLPADSVGTIMCNHVLEHVDDAKAMKELRRILKPDGVAILSVPIVEGWDKTYEADGIADDLMREVHFGQNDHIRYYGRDFRDRLKAAGFSKIEEVTAEGPDVVTYGLMRGEKFFICSQ